MKVYYTPSIFCRGKGPRGWAQKVNWQFEHAGMQRYIPVIYRFPKGIVFDVITPLDEAKLHEFYEKYGTDDEKLTPLQKRCVEQENPYQAVPVMEIWINGKRVESGYSSSGSAYIPWARQDDDLASVRKAYSRILKDATCFGCERFCVAYPEAGSRFQELLRFLRMEKVTNMKISTRPMDWFTPLDISFEMSLEDCRREVFFKHPVTGISHTLYFQNAELVEIPMGKDRNRSLFIMQSMYEIEPALPQGDTLQFNSSIQYTEPPKDRFSPVAVAASSIGIIGGASGPTVVSVTQRDKGKNMPQGLHGLPLYTCVSVPTFQKEDTYKFVLEGISSIKHDKSEYILK